MNNESNNNNKNFANDNKGYDNNSKGYDNKGYESNGKGYDNKGYESNSKGYDNRGYDNKGYDNKGCDNKGCDCKKRLQGAKFGLFNCEGCQIASGCTNCNGEIEFDCLPCGKYFLRELEAPCGYHKSNECVEICIDEHNLHKCAEFVNKRKQGSIKVIKFGC